MNTVEQSLWQKIEAFQFERPEAVLKFADRLARENNWTKDFTNRVILEYKRFIFLCCVSDKSVTPSDAVDQAWHLHLTYTKSYWVDLKNITGKEIHHNPTEGGKSESVKFDDQYNFTKSLYEQKFKIIQPADIWLPNKRRFSERFQRINITNNWVIRKPKLLFKSLATILFFISILSFIQASAGVWWFVGIVVFIVIIIIIIASNSDGGNKNNRNRRNGSSSSSSSSSSSDSGCGTGGFLIFGAGCGSSDSGSHSGSSGCGSSCGSSCGSGCGGGGCGS